MSGKSISNIAKQFGIKVVGNKQIRKGIFRVIAQNGQAYSLKRMPRPLSRLRWIDRMLLRVRNKGLRLVWRNPQTPVGSKLYAASPKNELYVLTPWIAGRMPSPRSLGDMRACGVALGRLHTSGREGLKEHFAYSEIGAWPQTLQARQRYLQNKIAKANRNGFGSMAINLSSGAMARKFYGMQTRRKHFCGAADISHTAIIRGYTACCATATEGRAILL